MSSNIPLDCSVALFQNWFFTQIEYGNNHYLTDAQIAEKAGISPGYYSNCKNGKTSISFNAAIKIADVVGLKVEFKVIPNEKKT